MPSGHAVCFHPRSLLPNTCSAGQAHPSQTSDAGAGVAFAFVCPGDDQAGQGTGAKIQLSLRCSAGEAGILLVPPLGKLGDK